MAWVTPTNVSTGDVLTASKWNTEVVANTSHLPRGVIGKNTAVTSNFTTSATHTTFQDVTGLTCSATYEANRMLRVNVTLAPYCSGGVQAVQYQILRGATIVAYIDFPSEGLAAGVAFSVSRAIILEGPSTAGTDTFKVQMRASSSNTAVNNYGNNVFPGRIIVEDLGAV
jgi:hypothetical protein